MSASPANISPPTAAAGYTTPAAVGPGTSGAPASGHSTPSSTVAPDNLASAMKKKGSTIDVDRMLLELRLQNKILAMTVDKAKTKAADALGEKIGPPLV